MSNHYHTQSAQEYANSFWIWFALAAAIFLFGGGWWALIGGIPAVLCVFYSCHHTRKTIR